MRDSNLQSSRRNAQQKTSSYFFNARFFCLVAIGSILCSSFAVNKVNAQTSWDEEIRAAQLQLDQLVHKANEIGHNVFLGSIYNEYHADENKCNIIGRILGQKQFVDHLKIEMPDDSAEEADYRLAAQALENWIYQAQQLLPMPASRLTQIWNLECVGWRGVPQSRRVEGGLPQAFFDIVDNGTTLRVLGDITEGFATRLIASLDLHPEIEVVALGSGGGSVREAILAGIEIRERRLGTTLWGNCYSACPLVFMSGSSRTIWSPYPTMGFHQLSDGELPLSFDNHVYTVVAAYVRSMGVGSDAVLKFMQMASPQEIFTPRMHDLCESGIATWVQRLC